MLTRYVKIFANFVVFADKIEKFVAYTLGIEVQKPDPLHVQLAKTIEKIDEHTPALEVVPVSGDVLRDDDKFLYRILREEVLGFFDNFFDGN